MTDVKLLFSIYKLTFYADGTYFYNDDRAHVYSWAYSPDLGLCWISNNQELEPRPFDDEFQAAYQAYLAKLVLEERQP